MIVNIDNMKRNALHCQYCGKKIKPNSKFCEGCGENLVYESEESDKREELTEEQQRKNRTINFHRLLEIPMILNAVLILVSLAINWRYLSSMDTQINLGIMILLSALNIFCLYGLYGGFKNYFYGLVTFGVISFVVYLSGRLLVLQLLLSIFTIIILYFFMFWLGYGSKEI